MAVLSQYPKLKKAVNPFNVLPDEEDNFSLSRILNRIPTKLSGAGETTASTIKILPPNPLRVVESSSPPPVRVIAPQSQSQPKVTVTEDPYYKFEPFQSTHYDPTKAKQTRPNNPKGFGAFGTKIEFGDIATGKREVPEDTLVFIKELQDVKTPFGMGVFRVKDRMNPRFNEISTYKFDIALPPGTPNKENLEKRIGNNMLTFKFLDRRTVKVSDKKNDTPVMKVMDGIRNITRSNSESTIGIDEPKLTKTLGQKISEFVSPSPEGIRPQDIVREIPQAGFETVRDVVQGIARSGGSVGLTLARKDEMPIDSSSPKWQQKAQEIIFGKEPVKSLSMRIAEGELRIQPYLKKIGAEKAALPTSFVGIALLTGLDFTGGGGEKNVLKVLAKTDDIAFISKTLRQIGVAEDFILPTATKMSKIGSEKEIKFALDKISELQKITKVAPAAAAVKEAEEFVKAEPRTYKDVEYTNISSKASKADFAVDKDNVGWITNLETKPEFRKQGEATKLVNEGLKFLQEKGVKEVRVIPENTISKKLFENFGFKQKGREFILTKSQLTDIWNQATKAVKEVAIPSAKTIPPELQSLAQFVGIEDLSKTLRGTKGMTADDIMKTHPNIKLTKDVPATDIYGNKVKIPEGEKLTPYELKANKILLQDGDTYIVSKNQFQNIKGQSVEAVGKPFAPELGGLEETVKGVSKWQGDELIDNNKTIADVVKNEDGTWSYRSDFSEGSDVFKSRAEAMKQAEMDTLGTYSEAGTKYSQYTLPGGKRYREVLIKAPEIKSEMSPKDIEEAQDLLRKTNRTPSEETRLEELSIMRKNADAGKNQNFKSPHWDEPNVISHIRLNDRTYNGKKVTFMEELQSDWARIGREKGYRGQIEFTEKDLINNGYKIKQLPDGSWQVDRGDGIKFDKQPTRQMAVDNATQRIGGSIEADKPPFNPNLKNWQELSIKRALKDAVDNKSDYFAWINGEQTSARYNLATYIDDVSWKKSLSPLSEKKGKKTIVINPKDSRGSWLIDINNKGEIESTAGGASAEMRGKKLDEVLGKGLADKIMEKESGTLSGEGLKFGGEWANNLYDKQVGNIVKDLTGAKIETLDMGLPIDAKSEVLKIVTDKGASGRGLMLKDLEIGRTISKDGNFYIITDILGEKGKFKAIPKQVLFDDFATKFPKIKASEIEDFIKNCL